jgi:hypothetical protein
LKHKPFGGTITCFTVSEKPLWIEGVDAAKLRSHIYFYRADRSVASGHVAGGQIGAARKSEQNKADAV